MMKLGDFAKAINGYNIHLIYVRDLEDLTPVTAYSSVDELKKSNKLNKYIHSFSVEPTLLWMKEIEMIVSIEILPKKSIFYPKESNKEEND